MDADELCTTPAERACLAALRAAAGRSGPMEAHCMRQFAICERLAGSEAFDREVLLCACWLHDAGLFVESDDPYVTEGARLAQDVLEPFGWDADRVRRCMDACEQHHAPTSRRDLGLEVELVRRSDLIDVSAGLITFGLDRAWLRSLFAEVPRAGFYRTIGGAVLGELRRRPVSLKGVFLPARRSA